MVLTSASLGGYYTYLEKCRPHPRTRAGRLDIAPDGRQPSHLRARDAARAHYGATARMVLTSQFLKSMEFLAYAMLPAGNVIEEHVDEVEEIYLIAQGGGVMKVGNEEKTVKEWDAIWIPAGEPHRLENNTEGMTLILVVAAYPKE